MEEILVIFPIKVLRIKEKLKKCNNFPEIPIAKKPNKFHKILQQKKKIIILAKKLKKNWKFIKDKLKVF